MDGYGATIARTRAAGRLSPLQATGDMLNMELAKADLMRREGLYLASENRYRTILNMAEREQLLLSGKDQIHWGLANIYMDQAGLVLGRGLEREARRCIRKIRVGVRRLT